MGYRGEDVPTTRGDWGRQTPWQPSSGATPGSAGAWDDGSRGYTDDEAYPPADGGFGYGPDGGYPGQGQQGYAPQDGQYGSAYGQPYEQQPYEQQPNGQYGGYGPGQGQAVAGGYGGPQGYPQTSDYGYEHGQNAPSGYGQAGYDQQPAPGYEPGGGYQDPSGYGQPPGYPAPSAGGYSGPRGGSGGYPALPPGGQGGYSAEDAGNDWYGGQPAAANGASFADTGTYRLNGRVIDEYGTGPRETLRDQNRGYPNGAGQQGTGPLPGPVNPAASGPQPFQRTGPQPFQRTGPHSVTETRGQQRYDERSAYPEYGKDAAGDATRGGYTAADAFAAPGYGGYGEAPSPSNDPAGDGYSGYGDGFNGGETDDDPYQDLYGDGADPRAGGGAGRRSGRAPRAARGPLGGKRLLFAALGVVAVGIIGVAAYAFVFKPHSPASNPGAHESLSTAGATPSTQACVQQLGTYCHIEAATDDPTPLTAAELYPPAFTDETDKTSYSLVATKVDKTCSNAVIGSALIAELKTGKCTQVVRGSYVSGNNKIMGTIGVINLSTTNEAHRAGRDVGENDFIAPLTSAKGVASKLGNGTGIVEAEYKGHYLILTWSEFVNGTNPTTTAEQNQLKQFSNDVVAETANIDLSQRMVTGAAPTPGASS
ncbi:MAG TPA: hypothetical protein VHT26_13565 [Trebonia sp.]|jgi:hypothetical protein|nr:hypothetical protein [Trebonia sp.]